MFRIFGKYYSLSVQQILPAITKTVIRVHFASALEHKNSLLLKHTKHW